MATTQEDDYSACAALVVDGNPTSRSILVSQLREFGVGAIVQCARAADARRQRGTMSPAMAAAAAVTGRITDVRKLERAHV